MKDWRTFLKQLQGTYKTVFFVQNKNTRFWTLRLLGEEDVSFSLGNIDYRDIFEMADSLIKDGIPTLLMKI